jgi:NAD(P)-dependent dehydrogenase (short-subunit alcohol dehydrogenase family)
VLVNNARITRDGLAVRMKPAGWGPVLRTNLDGSFLCIQQVLPGMMRKPLGTHHQYHRQRRRSWLCLHRHDQGICPRN